MGNFRIIRSPDKKCWIYQEFVPGGIHPVTKERGPDKWEIVGYYGKLEDLAIYLLNRQIEVPEGTLQEQIKGLRAEVKAAEARIAESLKQSLG